MIKIFNEDCLVTMKNMEPQSVSCVLTSPPYNTNKKAGKNTTLENVVSNSGYTHVRYDSYVDTMTNEEYYSKNIEWFNSFDRILKPNGSVLWNLSYGSENPECMINTVSEIMRNTNFTMADIITWKKHIALPNNMSSNKLTRICEYVYVFVRKSEYKTFYCNKGIKSIRSNGQRNYKNIYNFIEAKNNDGTCNLNKATYSTELCEKLLGLYCPENGTVYDPFSGTGTTLNACKIMDLNGMGSEISEKQCEFAKKRLNI